MNLGRDRSQDSCERLLAGSVVGTRGLLLPQPDLDLARWSVIACDQHTSDPAYWQETTRIVGSAPSTLHLVLPEVYLNQESPAQIQSRIASIQSRMRSYFGSGLLRELPAGAILCQRDTFCQKGRLGLIATIDLEAYHFNPEVHSLIRATEETVRDRIPPRLAVRRGATLELPHTLVLIDDPEHTVLKPLLAHVTGRSPEYETSLMQNGGAIRGWFFHENEPALQQAFSALSCLPSLRQDELLMVVGDGNHSLATAKAYWQELKQAGADPATHPARHALVEIGNLHDPALEVEPIHRLICGITVQEFLQAAQHYFGTRLRVLESDTAPAEITAELWSNESSIRIALAPSEQHLPVAQWQRFLDQQWPDRPSPVDYIHGDAELRSLACDGRIGLRMPHIAKSVIFDHIIRRGLMPRKAFSLGEAAEKRYYLESRVIDPVCMLRPSGNV